MTVLAGFSHSPGLNERPGSEDEIWLRPSSRLWRLRLLEVSFLMISSAAVSAGVGFGFGSAATGIWATISLLLLGLVTMFVLRRRFLAWAYCEREDDLIVVRGVLFRRLSVIPYGRMQFVDVTAGPLERAFHLSTVRMHTAAAASDARIPGLEVDEAARLRDQLAALGESMAAGL